MSHTHSLHKFFFFSFGSVLLTLTSKNLKGGLSPEHRAEKNALQNSKKSLIMVPIAAVLAIVINSMENFFQDGPLVLKNSMGLKPSLSLVHVYRFIKSKVLRVSPSRRKPFVIAATDLCFVQGNLLIHYAPLETV